MGIDSFPEAIHSGWIERPEDSRCEQVGGTRNDSEARLNSWITDGPAKESRVPLEDEQGWASNGGHDG